MRHTSKILALSLAFIMTLMTLVPYQAGLGVSFANSDAAGKVTEESAEQPGENYTAGDVAAPDENGDLTDQEDNDSAEDEAASEAASTIGFEGKEFDVKIESDPAAGLPDDTELSVEEITGKDKKYTEYYEKAVAAVQSDAKDKKTRTVRFVRLYDFELASGGEIIEPDADVDVTIDYSKAIKGGKAEAAEDPENVRIVHFTKNEKGEPEAELLEKDAVGASVDESALAETSFIADSFSVYAVVYTVDFHYGDGEYDFSIEGESSIMLSEVIERLHMGDLTIFDVRDAKFSDPGLVKVEKVKGAADAENGTAPADDWKLTSLKPFDTDETLTLTLNDGSEVVVKVTDAAPVEEFVPINNNSVITNAVGHSTFPVYYAFDNGAIVSGNDIGMPTVLNSQRINNTAAVVSAGADKSAFQAAWNAALGTSNVGVTVNRAWAENNTLQIQLAFTAANGNVYYSSQYGVTNSDNNTNQVRNEINNNRYMLVGDDKIVVRLTLANSNNAHYAKDGITYGSTQNSTVKAFATELDADTYGSNMLPATVSIAGVPYTVVDNITTFKENNVTYSLDKRNLRQLLLPELPVPVQLM